MDNNFYLREKDRELNNLAMNKNISSVNSRLPPISGNSNHGGYDNWPGSTQNQRSQVSGTQNIRAQNFNAGDGYNYNIGEKNNEFNNHNNYGYNNFNNKILNVENGKSEIDSRKQSSNSRPNVNSRGSNFDNFSQSNNSDNLIQQEINHMKRLVKNVLENQNEMQGKIIEYNKIISEQENIIRLNNIKLNEHDSKLTEILITFNNYLQLNDKTTRIINDLSSKSDDFIKKSEFNDLKSTMYNFNRNNETKILENSNKIEEVILKTTEITKEQEIFQKYTLEKLKAYQTEAMENRLQQQQQLIKLEESRETKMSQQFDQIKGLIKILEKNISNETVYRKNMIENSIEEVIQLISKKEDKIIALEKNQLETEKKLINLNKEYITTFQELILKNNQKYDIEFKSLKSILDTGFMKLDVKINEYTKDYENTIFDLRKDNQEIKSTLTQLDIITKDGIENLEKKYQVFEMSSEGLRYKVETTADTLNKFMNENLVFVENKIQDKFNSLENKFTKIFVEYNGNIQILEIKTQNSIKDLSEKIDNTNKLAVELSLKTINPVENNINQDKLNKSPNTIDLLLFEKKIDEKVQVVKNEMEDFEKKLIILMNLHIDTFKKNLNEEQQKLVDNISDKLDTKISVLQKEIEQNTKEADLIKEGRLQEYIIESEERLKKVLELRINKIQEELETINIKTSYRDN